jgi:hypothetical protein
MAWKRLCGQLLFLSYKVFWCWARASHAGEAIKNHLAGGGTMCCGRDERQVMGAACIDCCCCLHVAVIYAELLTCSADRQ